jgi:hypothetical protein
MESVKVPQHLELQDVVAWGMGAVDLLCVVGALALAWCLYLALPGEVALRAAAVAPLGLCGLACGLVRADDVALREWAFIAFAYAVRPRLLVVA